MCIRDRACARQFKLEPLNTTPAMASRNPDEISADRAQKTGTDQHINQHLQLVDVRQSFGAPHQTSPHHKPHTEPEGDPGNNGKAGDFGGA